MASPFYSLDITGVNASNRVVDEPHTVQVPTGAMASFIVPKYAPFNGDNITVKHGAAGSQTTLTKGVHYVLRHHFIHAEEALGKHFYGSIMFIDRTLSGPVTVTYNTLGGVYASDVADIIIDRTNSYIAQQTVTWDQIIGVPAMLPPVAHDHDAEELKGWDDLIQATDSLADAIRDPDNTDPLLVTIHQLLLAHIDDENNPHNTNKEKVFLNAVANFPPSTDAQSRDRTNNSTVTTPRGVYQAMLEHFSGLLQPHVNDTSLHPQSPGDIGLGNVQNFGVASTSQAYAGTSTQAYMLPSLMKDAVMGALSAPTASTLPSQFLGLAYRMEGSNGEAPAQGNAQWLVINFYAGSLTNAPTLTTQRYQIALSLGSAGAFRGLHCRVQNNATPQNWIRLDGGTRATANDIYTVNQEAYLTPETVKEAYLKAKSADSTTADPISFFGPVGFFNGPGTPDGGQSATSLWKIENVYASELGNAPSGSVPRMQVAMEFHNESTDSPVRTFTRSIVNGVGSGWVQSGSNLTEVPNWSPAQASDMSYNTSVNNRFVAPVNVRQFSENRFGTFMQRVTAGPTPPASSGAREGDIHFQIL